MPRLADRFTYPVSGGYKQRDRDPHDVIQAGDYYRTNWIGAAYNLLGTIPSVHEGDDIVRMDQPCYGDPVYATANGVVTFAQDVVNLTWRQMVEIEHTLSNGTKVWSRYAHLRTMTVMKGQDVTIGQQIGTIGDSSGRFTPHLHFSICITPRMVNSPLDWPSTGHNESAAKTIIFANYTDPLIYITERLNMIDNPDTAAAMRAALTALPKGTPVTIVPALPPDREPLGTQLAYIVAVEDVLATAEPPTPRATLTKYVTASPSMNVRATPATTQAPVGTLAYQTAVTVYADQPDAAWWQIAATNAQFPGDYLAAQWLSAERP